MPDFIKKIVDDATMEKLLTMAKAMADTAISKKDLIATSIVSFVIGGFTYYLYIRRTQSKSKASEMAELPSSSINRNSRPAPLVQLGIDPVTGLPEITPPDKIVHQAPDRYGSAAPGPHGMEIHEEVARQQARDADEANATQTRQARNQSVLGSIKRVQDMGGNTGNSETAQGGVATAVRGTGGLGGGAGASVGGGYGGGHGYDLDDGDEVSQRPSTQDAGQRESDEEGSTDDAADEESWNESIFGPRYSSH